ncbi:hypothetical protein C8F04DRAFT_1263371 [Mycena alexandri]|uniref:Uncharacterized protein n=1 Tax=Mycena alexandri TaxID=1745969 RepID=A0AAD6SMX0_9AGAR|nr:hypothetical protein C8F04DRAFT_1263371 [Mycena alexandri]
MYTIGKWSGNGCSCGVAEQASVLPANQLDLARRALSTGFIAFTLTWNDWRPRSYSAPAEAVRTSSQTRFPESAAWFDAAKTTCPRGRRNALIDDTFRLCPRAPALAHAPEERHILISILRTNTTPPAHLCMLERRLTHLQLVSYTHATARSHLVSAPARPRLGSAVLLRPTFPRHIAKQQFAGILRAHPRAYRRRTVGARCCTDLNPSAHGHRPPSFSSFSVEMEMLTCALNATLPLAPHIASLPSSSVCPARSRVLARLIVRTRTPSRPHMSAHALLRAPLPPPACCLL